LEAVIPDVEKIVAAARQVVEGAAHSG
jgi:hypothetical protein